MKQCGTSAGIVVLQTKIRSRDIPNTKLEW
jgi:hypothetical protein